MGLVRFAVAIAIGGIIGIVGMLLTWSIVGAIFGVPLLLIALAIMFRELGVFISEKTGRPFWKELFTKGMKIDFALILLGVLLTGSTIGAIIGVPLVIIGVVRIWLELSKMIQLPGKPLPKA